MSEEILIVRKEKWAPQLKIKVTDRRTHGWAPSKYEKVIGNKDYNNLAFLFYDLSRMDYPVDKAYKKFKNLVEKPDWLWQK